MPKNSIQVVISVSFIEDGIDQNLTWCKEEHEYKVEERSVWHSSTEPTLYHIGCKNQESNKRSVEKSLSSFREPHLNLVSMLE
jgi:hypothetical protein